ARQVDRLRVLNELDRALSATLDPAQVAQVTLERIVTALKAPAGFLILLASFSDQAAVGVLGPDGQWHTLGTAEQRAAVYRLLSRLDEKEAQALGAAELAWLPQPPEHGGLAMPIRGDEDIIGLLILSGPSMEGSLTEENRALALAAISRAGQALQNARLYDRLRYLLREREKAQAQLVHSEKMAALGRLVASIAHEINNPLQSVDGCLTLVMEEWVGERRQEKMERYLNIIREEIDRTAGIVRRMRDFYRPARQGLQPVDLHGVLDSVLDLVGKQLEHRYVAVERHWAADLPRVEANGDHLKQVFLNLVLNAVDAMPSGGTLRLSTARAQMDSGSEELPRPAVRIEFRDTGQGMSAQVLAHIFEPFFTTKEHGSGLGLAISYGIIEDHHGRITVESREGKGTIFTMLLPEEQPPQR
ncbi:MAG: hypothetical protein JXA37_10225, partial [Chloroflexia bacterium]|nr:hypothetical protein [Chloroflexia bacterium]